MWDSTGHITELQKASSFTGWLARRLGIYIQLCPERKLIQTKRHVQVRAPPGANSPINEDPHAYGSSGLYSQIVGSGPGESIQVSLRCRFWPLTGMRALARNLTHDGAFPGVALTCKSDNVDAGWRSYSITKCLRVRKT